MRIIFLTNSIQGLNGWSIVGKNLVSNIPGIIDVYQSEKSLSFLFNKRSLKSEALFNYGFLAAFFDFFIIIRNQKTPPDIIHCNIELFAPLAFLLSLYYKKPYTITVHGTYGLLPLKKWSYSYSFKKASKLICVSRYTKKRLVEEGIKGEYDLILSGVDKNFFKPQKLVQKENIILFVGNYKKRKGYCFLLEALILLKNDLNDFTLYFVGDINFNSPEHIKYSKIAARHEIKIKYFSNITDTQLVKIYNKAKLNVLPSFSSIYNFEGFGLIHLESISCGTLTVGTLNSGNEDAIHSENGFLVNYGDIIGLKNIMHQVMTCEEYPKTNLTLINDWSETALSYYKVFKSLLLQTKA